MVRTFFRVCLLVFMTSALFGQDLSPYDLSSRDINGKKVNLKNLLEKGPVLIDFWALWCVPCLKELPQIQKIHQRYGDSGLTIVAVNEDSPSDQSKVKPFVRKKRFDFVVVFDEDKDLSDLFKVISLPTTILLESNGNIIYSHTGYKPGDEAVLIEKLEDLFKKKSHD